MKERGELFLTKSPLLLNVLASLSDALKASNAEEVIIACVHQYRKKCYVRLAPIVLLSDEGKKLLASLKPHEVLVFFENRPWSLVAESISIIINMDPLNRATEAMQPFIDKKVAEILAEPQKALFFNLGAFGHEPEMRDRASLEPEFMTLKIHVAIHEDAMKQIDQVVGGFNEAINYKSQ